MFTGLVTERGVVRRVEVGKDRIMTLEVEARALSSALEKGDSVAVNGVCLTATKIKRKSFVADVVPETLTKTTLASVTPGRAVNLEIPPTPADRLGGHFVQGHVDGIANVVRIEREGDSTRMWFEPQLELMRYVVPKGSVTIDGVSLTVAAAGRASFSVALVPHTLSVTTLGNLDVGERVNVEVDVVAKYVERLIGALAPQREE